MDEKEWKLVQRKRDLLKRMEERRRMQDILNMAVQSRDEGAQLETKRAVMQREKRAKELMKRLLEKHKQCLNELEAHEEEIRMDLWLEEMLEVSLLGSEFRICVSMTAASVSRQECEKQTHVEASTLTKYQISNSHKEEFTLIYLEEKLRDVVETSQNTTFGAAFTSFTSTLQQITTAERVRAEGEEEAYKLRLEQEQARKGKHDLRIAEEALERVEHRLSVAVAKLNIS